MLRAALVDDEPLALQRMARLLERTGRAEVVLAIPDPMEALSQLMRTRVDVLFLDIHMPGLTGFELLGKLPAPPAVIITTAHPQYALQAFRNNSLDYLLKPVNPDHLDQALSKVERLQGAYPAIDIQALSQALAATIQPANPPMTRIPARLGTRITFLETHDVVYFHAQDKLTHAMTDGRALCVEHTLAELEARLATQGFLRIHRAVLLNTAWIREVQTTSSGTLVLHLKDTRNSELEVAKGRARDVRERLGI